MDLKHRLAEAIQDLRISKRIRKELTKHLEQLQSNVIPPLFKVYELFEELNNAEICVHLEPDRSCEWLRHNAQVQGLRKPRYAEKVYCRRDDSKNVKHSKYSCEAYKPVKI
jgi:hypothetical protein